MICDCLLTDLPHWSPIYFFNNDKRKKACVVIYLLYKLGCCMCNNFFLCQQLWESGFSLSYSKASGVLNGDKINRTIYYILSNVPAPMHDASTSKRERNAIEKVLYFPDRCYQGHSTLWVKQKRFFYYHSCWEMFHSNNTPYDVNIIADKYFISRIHIVSFESLVRSVSFQEYALWALMWLRNVSLQNIHCDVRFINFWKQYLMDKRTPKKINVEG